MYHILNPCLLVPILEYTHVLHWESWCWCHRSRRKFYALSPTKYWMLFLHEYPSGIMNVLLTTNILFFEFHKSLYIYKILLHRICVTNNIFQILWILKFHWTYLYLKSIDCESTSPTKILSELIKKSLGRNELPSLIVNLMHATHWQNFYSEYNYEDKFQASPKLFLETYFTSILSDCESRYD